MTQPEQCLGRSAAARSLCPALRVRAVVETVLTPARRGDDVSDIGKERTILVSTLLVYARHVTEATSLLGPL